MAKLEIFSLHERPELFDDSIKLIEECFDYARPHRFEVDFYPLVKKSNSRNLYVLLEAGRVIAHLGFLPKKLKFGSATWPTLLLGGIAIAKEFRGQGHFHALWEHFLKVAPESLGYILWSELEDFYTKYGFCQIGMVETIGEGKGATPPSYRHQPYKDLSPVQKGEIRDIFERFTQDLVTLERDDNAWNDIESITSSNLFINLNKNGKVGSYFFIDKGQDLQGVIHEAFGESLLERDFADCLRWPPKRDIRQISQNIIYSCFFKIGNVELFKNFVQVISNGEISIQEANQSKIQFSLKGENYQISPQDFLQGLFGPALIDEFKPFYRPLWFGGLDSV